MKLRSRRAERPRRRSSEVVLNREQQPEDRIRQIVLSRIDQIQLGIQTDGVILEGDANKVGRLCLWLYTAAILEQYLGETIIQPAFFKGMGPRLLRQGKRKAEEFSRGKIVAQWVDDLANDFNTTEILGMLHQFFPTEQSFQLSDAEFSALLSKVKEVSPQHKEFRWALNLIRLRPDRRKEVESWVQGIEIGEEYYFGGAAEYAARVLIQPEDRKIMKSWETDILNDVDRVLPKSGGVNLLTHATAFSILLAQHAELDQNGLVKLEQQSKRLPQAHTLPDRPMV